MVYNDSNKNTTFKTKDSSEEIDLSKLFRNLIRFKKLFSLITFTTIFFSLLYGYLKKPSWVGEFQIVLSEKNAPSKLDFLQNPALSKLVGVNNSSSSLQTEVEILKSPSVLMPIFNYVKLEKEKDGKDVSSWYFSDWKRDLNVELEQGTSVLNISYKDKKKDIILEVLDKISDAYQNYSGKERTKNLNKGLKFLEEQINIYKDKSSNSTKNAISFAIQKDLLVNNNNNINNNNFSNQNVESLRIRAVNKIRNLDQILIQLNKLKNGNDDAYLYFVKSVPKLNKIDIVIKIEEINNEISDRRATFTENDEGIKSLLKEKNFFKNTKEKTEGFIKAEKASQLAQQYAAERPEETLIKYKQLFARAQSDQKILRDLESEKGILSLEKAKTKDPWELITKPTLLSKPKSISKKIYLIVGFFIGFIISSISAYLIDKEDTINFEDEVGSLINTSLIGEAAFSSTIKFKEDIKLICHGIINRFKKIR